MSLRFTKSEMAFEAPRLQAWEARSKFLLIASLAYAFLLSLLTNTEFLFNFISRYCHRTGKWSRDLRLLFEEEHSLRLSDEEREGLIRDNTRKLYMAATRAGQRLVLTYSGKLPEVLKSALEMKTSL